MSRLALPLLAAWGLIVGAAGLSVGLIAGEISQRPPFSCSTDAECALMPECLADAACDGGPESGAR